MNVHTPTMFARRARATQIDISSMAEVQACEACRILVIADCRVHRRSYASGTPRLESSMAMMVEFAFTPWVGGTNSLDRLKYRRVIGKEARRYRY